jgi:hypothetical protein
VRYLCKYLTKNVADTYSDQHPTKQAAAAAYERHIDRLHAEVLVLPCSPWCPNWLRYGVTPKDAGPGLIPGLCPSPAHDRENLGLGGRRVLVSRQWTGKTLTEHRADRRQVVAQVLVAAGIDAPDADRLAADQTLPDGTPRFVWADADPDETTYVAVIAASLRQAQTWREQYHRAKAVAADSRSSPGNSPSATTSWRTPAPRPLLLPGRAVKGGAQRHPAGARSALDGPAPDQTIRERVAVPGTSTTKLGGRHV